MSNFLEVRWWSTPQQIIKLHLVPIKTFNSNLIIVQQSFDTDHIEIEDNIQTFLVYHFRE